MNKMTWQQKLVRVVSQYQTTSLILMKCQNLSLSVQGRSSLLVEGLSNEMKLMKTQKLHYKTRASVAWNIYMFLCNLK